MGVIRFTEEIWRKLREHLLSGSGEQFAFIVADHSIADGEAVFLTRDAVCVPSTHAWPSADGWTVKPEGFLPAINVAVRSGAALIECHNHGGAQPRFSKTDRLGLEEFRAYVFESLPGRPYAATVWGDSSVYGDVFFPDGRSGPIRSISVTGTRLRQVVSRDDDQDRLAASFDRQLAWFTQDGQRDLGRIRAAIVGAGGTGSHMAQQLAFLGVRDFVLVDHDTADETSMNRLVTAAAADVGTPKVFLARRVIKSIAPTAKVKAIVSNAQSKEALDALKGVDIVFGCVDNDGARLILNELSQAFCIPLFDVAVGIEVEDGNVTVAGGRVVAVMPGGPCLLCCGEIDADEARFFLNDPQEQAFQLERGYVQGAEVTAPSVVSLNGSIASTAVNEFAVFVSGVRPVQVFTELDLIGLGHPTKGQRLALRRVTSDPHCVACTVRGLGDRAGIDRYAKVS